MVSDFLFDKESILKYFLEGEGGRGRGWFFYIN